MPLSRTVDFRFVPRLRDLGVTQLDIPGAIANYQGLMPMVSFTLPVDPAGLPGSALDSGKNMGDLAISAANSTYKQIKGIFTGRTDAQLWTMIGITPMFGVNDVATEVFRQADAQNLGDFAKQKKPGRLSFWNLQRDRYMGSAYYGRLNVNSGTAVDLQASSLNDGANIHQWTNSTRHWTRCAAPAWAPRRRLTRRAPLWRRTPGLTR